MNKLNKTLLGTLILLVVAHGYSEVPSDSKKNVSQEFVQLPEKRSVSSVKPEKKTQKVNKKKHL